MKGVKFPYREVVTRQLFDELVVAGYTCKIAHSNRVFEDGVVVLETQAGERLTRAMRVGHSVLRDGNGVEVPPGDARPRKTAQRHIWIYCNEEIDRATVQAVLDAHDVTPKLRDDRKAEALVEAKALINPGASLATPANRIAAVQESLDDLYDAIAAMTLADLKEFNVKTWAGWPTQP